MRFQIRVLVAAIALGAWPVLSETHKGDPVRAVIEKQATLFSEAFARADFEAVAGMYAEDAIVLPPDAEMVKGRPAIEALWKSVHASGVKGVTLTVVDVHSSGKLAVEVGTAVLSIKPEGKPELTQSAKYVVVWRRQKDGSWKLYRDIWNAMPQQAQR